MWGPNKTGRQTVGVSSSPKMPTTPGPVIRRTSPPYAQTERACATLRTTRAGSSTPSSAPTPPTGAGSSSASRITVASGFSKCTPTAATFGRFLASRASSRALSPGAREPKKTRTTSSADKKGVVKKEHSDDDGNNYYYHDMGRETAAGNRLM